MTAKLTLTLVIMALALGGCASTSSEERARAATVRVVEDADVANNLCPPLPPRTEEGDWRARESEFDEKSFTDAMNYFEETLPRALHDRPKTEDVLESETFVISYPNSLTSIKGHVLRQDALLRIVERDLIVQKTQQGRASKADVTTANARVEEARRRFCEFLSGARFND
jgi:hypothetical protein